ncbi:hypothetical protein JCM15548_12629 [Geofilum rubicundum JCM 15548]|uniref:Uncharacterized protein n=1 Tax=Geofilum rubicundum JCM 15548 TaxID=1236989 RepID=A0A0E9LYQ0_9BACT|nr:hypothetical protein JCM15548_12629 [Geofilum rubicundum JCM 15548]
MAQPLIVYDCPVKTAPDFFSAFIGPSKVDRDRNKIIENSINNLQNGKNNWN